MSQYAEESKPAEPAPSSFGSPRAIVLFLLTALGVIGCLLLGGAFVPAVTWAVALAVIIHKPYRWLAAKLGKPAIASAVAVFVLLLLLVAPLTLIAYSIGSQLLALVALFRSGAAQDWAAGMLATYPHINAAAQKLQGVVSFKEGTQAAAGYLAGKLQGVLAGSVRTVTQLGIMVFTLFFLLKDGAAFRRAFLSVIPTGRSDADTLVQRMAETISASLQGSLTIAAIQGSLGGLMFWFLAVPQAFLWAFLMGLLALIPSLGTFLIWMPVAVFLALSGHPVKALILFAWGVLVIGSVDNLLYPSLVGNRLRLHTIPIFFAVLGGIALFGLTGLVLGPLLLTTTLALLHLYNPEILPLAEPSAKS